MLKCIPIQCYCWIMYTLNCIGDVFPSQLSHYLVCPDFYRQLQSSAMFFLWFWWMSHYCCSLGCSWPGRSLFFAIIMQTNVNSSFLSQLWYVSVWEMKVNKCLFHWCFSFSSVELQATDICQKSPRQNKIYWKPRNLFEEPSSLTVLPTL